MAGFTSSYFSTIKAVAPMINQSDAPFRALCLKHGASCAYTEMLDSSRIVGEPNSYLESVIPPADHSFEEYQTRPLVAQLQGNDPDLLATAAAAVFSQGRVDAIDLNLGCPQERAKLELFGSYLLDKCHWLRVFKCVAAMVEAVDRKIPIFCKIRICESSDSSPEDTTVAFCRGLLKAGASLIAIHGRTRGSTKLRRNGPADIALIGRVAAQLQRDFQPYEARPVILINGNMCTRSDVRSVLSSAGPHCSGVMSAEGLLADPALFSLDDHKRDPKKQEKEEEKEKEKEKEDEEKEKEKEKEIGFCLPVWFSTFATSPSVSLSLTAPPDRAELFLEYCRLSDEYGAAGGWAALEKAEKRYFGEQKPEVTAEVSAESSSSSSSSSSKQSNMNRSSNSGSQSGSNSETEAKQLSVARQHLAYMLQKSGHGRSVRFRHSGAHAKHAQLWQRVQGAHTMGELRSVATECLQGVHSSDPYEER